MSGVLYAAKRGAGPVAYFDFLRKASSWTILAVGEKKINVIKEVRAITGLGLVEAKGLVEAAPKAVKEAVSKDEADKIKAQLEAEIGRAHV